jgi:hypothetical protein
MCIADIHCGFLLGLFFNPEDGGDIFLRKGGELSTDYIITAVRISHPALFIVVGKTRSSKRWGRM